MSDDYYGLAVLEFDAVRVDHGEFETLTLSGDVALVRVHGAPIMDVSREGQGS